jgi:protein SCO1
MTRAVAALLLVLMAARVEAQSAVPASATPGVLREIGFDQHMGRALPGGLHFLDEASRGVVLEDFFQDRPVVLALVYFSCPMLCLQTLENLARSVDALPFRAGRRFDVLAVSFDPHDTPALAASRKAALFARSPAAAEGWHFLTGNRPEITQLTAAVGFKYVFDDSLQQFAHPVGLTVLTPDGRISRYLFGIDYKPIDLRLAILDASEHRVGSVTDSMLLYCYHYEPTTGRYGLLVMRLVRTAASATVLCLAVLVITLVRRDRRRRR